MVRLGKGGGRGGYLPLSFSFSSVGVGNLHQLASRGTPWLFYGPLGTLSWSDTAILMGGNRIKHYSILSLRYLGVVVAWAKGDIKTCLLLSMGDDGNVASQVLFMSSILAPTSDFLA